MKQKEMKQMMLHKIEVNVLMGADWHNKLLKDYRSLDEAGKDSYRRLRQSSETEAFTIINLMKDFGFISEKQAEKMREDVFNRIHTY